ncbi:MAG: diacylglycerol kinase [Patescibacteria group bacterium]|nr:diacylglycerol kinase [Patescibacteria group bacterium]
MFKIKRIVRSFKNAFRGLITVFKEEQSFRVQVVAAIVIFCLAAYFSVKMWEAIILVLVVSFVLVLEVLNSILERLVDALKPRIHPYVKAIKDMMAATVLLASITALVIGFLIFSSYLL